MKKYYIIMTIAALFIFIGCGSQSGPDLSPEASSKTVKNLPDWYLNTPVNEGFKYSAAEATSQSMQLAIDKARVAAVSNLSQMIKSEWNGYTKRVQEETGMGSDSNLLDQFSSTQENVISNQLEGVIVKEKDVQVENSDGTRIYRVFVLVEFDENAANDKILAKIKNDQELYDAIKASELVDEMEQKVEAYRQRNSNP
jgi:ABC-type Fe3+-hydroxamate transport system substrate-binding protein